MILGGKPFLSAVKHITFWNFMKRVPNILTTWCLNKFLKFIITILDAQMKLKMLIVGPRIIKIRSYHQLFLFGTQFVRSNYSKAAIKSYSSENVIKIPKYFLYGSRKGQILYARLRMRNSSLNDHLFHCNLSNTKLCACDQIETTKHYLLECPNYTALRLRTISTLPFQINTDILLYGGELLSDEQNIMMNQQTLTFILESKRFN